MLKKSIVLLALALAAQAQAQSAGNDVLVEEFDDFVAFELDNNNADMQLSISGPNGFFRSEKHPGNQPAFVEVRPFGGGSLEDGLYKYEIVPVPQVAYSREESSVTRMAHSRRLFGYDEAPRGGAAMNSKRRTESLPHLECPLCGEPADLRGR